MPSRGVHPLLDSGDVPTIFYLSHHDLELIIFVEKNRSLYAKPHVVLLKLVLKALDLEKIGIDGSHCLVLLGFRFFRV